MDMMQMNGMGGMGPLMMIGMILVWALVIAAVVWLVRRLIRGRSGSAPSPRGESPETLLKNRYARGEIDRSTYERMREDLQDEPGAEGRAG